MHDTCRRGHLILTPRDRLPSGQCRQCDREAHDRYAARRRTAMDLLRAYETRGVGISDIPKPERLRVALAAIEACSDEQLKHAALMDPDLFRRALQNVEAMADN